MVATFIEALTDEETAEMHAVGRRQSYGPAVTLFHEGDDAGPVVVLLSGRVKVSTVGRGREAIVAVRGPGDLIGELSTIDGGLRSATVTTLERAEALLVRGSALDALLERRPRIALVILRMVAARLRYADSQQTQFATHDVVGRVAHRLVELADRFGDAKDGRTEIALPISQEELAAWTGASREAVSKALQTLRSLRIVETGRKHITVLDPAALRWRARDVHGHRHGTDPAGRSRRAPPHPPPPNVRSATLAPLACKAEDRRAHGRARGHAHDAVQRHRGLDQASRAPRRRLRGRAERPPWDRAVGDRGA
jgi:CRP-like cAMP-binding protein